MIPDYIPGEYAREFTGWVAEIRGYANQAYGAMCSKANWLRNNEIVAAAEQQMSAAGENDPDHANAKLVWEACRDVADWERANYDRWQGVRDGNFHLNDTRHAFFRIK